MSVSWGFSVLHCVIVLIIVNISSQQEQCQKVSAIFTGTENTGAPVAYDDIEPDTTNCEVNSAGSHVLCSVGSVLSDGDIGPTHSVDVSDPDQVHRFFVWNRVNGTVALQFQRNNAFSRFNVSYIDIYTLSAPSARIGSPGTTSFTTLEGGTVSSLNTQSCSFSSSASTLSRTTFNMSLTNIKALAIRFEFTSQDIDWLFISEIQLCEGNAPSSISCDPPPTDTPTQTPTPPPSPTPPPMTLTPLPSPVTPDLHQPDSVSLTCSVASPATDDYQYQWQWWKNRTLLNTQFTITNTTNTQSSSLHISGLGYSDAGEYMCGVQYAMCPDGVDCSGATPVTGNIQLNLPVVVEVESPGTVFTGEGSEVDLTCEIYGYPRDSSSPVWTRGSDKLQNDRYTTTVINAGLLSGSSISSTERVVSQLTIRNVTEDDSGEYTCSVPGNSTTATLTVIGNPTSSGQSSGMVAGIVVAVLLFLIVLIATLAIIVWMIWWYHKNGKLDSCNTFSCGTCSCLSVCTRFKNFKMPVARRHDLNKNGSVAAERGYAANDIEVDIYSSVQKPSGKGESPPPLPPHTLTETELDNLMSASDEEASPTHQKPSRRSTAISVYSQSGLTPKLAKVRKLKKFKMKENPIYQSADDDNGQHENPETAVYAMPSKTNASNNYTDETTSDPIYSEAINPTMFTKRASTIVTDDDIFPYAPIYARPVKPTKNTRQPLEIGEENIREIKQIGVGQFGAVILAEMSGLKSADLKLLPKGVGEDGPTLVAVKRLKPDVSEEIWKSFDKEIKFMSQLEHENIVQLLAICKQSDNPFIAMEYMESGDLNQFLQRYQTVDDDVALYSNQIPSSVLLYMSVQIASGMCYLASLNYVHRDLATRNCLVGSNFRIKISDFGMSKNLYERVYYRVRGRAMLPIRWMATESFYGRFSEKSDIWAYGVVVWEIFTLGKKQPYEELDDQEMIQDAIRGTGRRIMNRPEECPQTVYKVLLRCWEYAAEDRATFKEVYESLLSIQQNC